MRFFLLPLLLGVTFIATGMYASAGQSADRCLNPYNGRRERAETFEFADEPLVKKQGDGYVISFAVSAACDATVAIIDSEGRFVRHLASGVLGKNAPWPYAQNSLSQSIPWDGKDDRGKSAPAGCKVKVSLGLKASLDRFLGWSPEAMPVKRLAGLTAGPDGNVFAVTMAKEGGGLQSTTINVYVFDRRGRYVRRLLPPPAHLPPAKSTIMGWLKTDWGDHVPVRRKSNITHTVVRKPGWAIVPLQTPVVTSDGKFVFLVPDDKRKKKYSLIRVDIKDGSTPPGSISSVKFEGGTPGFETLHMAASPDGTWLYIGGGSDFHKEYKRTHAIWRLSLAKPAKAKLFLGKRRKSGKGNTMFNRPRGMACDKVGNLYVADSGNNRLQVFKPDGSLLKSIPAKTPERVLVSHRTGEIYLIKDNAKTLVVLGGLEDPSIKASMKIGGSMKNPGYVPSMGLVDDGPTHSVWLGRCSWSGLKGIERFERKKAGFIKVAAAGVHAPKGWSKWQPWTPAPYLVADPFREELYVRHFGMCYAGNGMRVNGRNGTVIENFIFKRGKQPMNRGNRGVFEECVVGSDRLIYMRLTDNGNWIAPYDPDKQQFVKRKGYRHAAKLTMNGKKVWGFPARHKSTGFNFAYPMGIAPNGDLYVPCRPHTPLNEWKGFNGWRVDHKDNHFYRELRVYSSHGKLKCRNALPGMGTSDGVRIGRHGAVYVVLPCNPIKQKKPEGIAARSFPRSVWGTLFKFSSRFDTYPVGEVVVDKKEGTHDYYMGPRANVRVKGTAWEYAGVGPASFFHCHCWKSTFDLDSYERVWLPAAPTCTVNVLDANGNIVMRIGGYGNADCMGKDSPVIDPKTGELRPRRKDDPDDLKSPLREPELGFLDPSFVSVTDEALYVHDRGNERIVRAKLVYHTEETIALP